MGHLGVRVKEEQVIVLQVEPDDQDAIKTERILGGIALIRRVKTAIQAIDYLKATATDRNGGRPDLLLTNAFLPVLDGEMLLSWVRNQPELKALPVAIQTDESDPALRKRLLDAGADHVLDKKDYGAGLALAIQRGPVERGPLNPTYVVSEHSTVPVLHTTRPL